LKSGAFKSNAFKSGVLRIEPDVFGVEGKIVSAIDANDVDKMLSDAMHAASAKHVRAAKSREQLKRLALANGIFFETSIPVSGKKEAEDRAPNPQSEPAVDAGSFNGTVRACTQ
jgi:hypothetical protein